MMDKQHKFDSQAVVNFAFQQCENDPVRVINACKAALHRVCIEMPGGKQLVHQLDQVWASMQDAAVAAVKAKA